MDSQNLDTYQSQLKQNNFFLDPLPTEDSNEHFPSNILPEGYISFNRINKQKKCSIQKSNYEPPSQDIVCNQHEDLQSFPQSPNLRSKRGQSIFKKIHNESNDQIDSIRSYNPFMSVDASKPRNLYSSLLQYNHIKTFMRKLSNKKNMCSQFTQYHFDAINDKGSVSNIKLFKDSGVNIKPISKQLQKTQKVPIRQIITKQIQSKLNQLFQNTNQIMEKIPLFFPETMSRLLWDGIVQIARIYFLFVIPLDLSFNQEQFMFKKLYSATILMIIVLIMDLFVSLNTAHYVQGQIVAQRSLIARHVLAKCGGLEFVSLAILVAFWAQKEHSKYYKVNEESQKYQLCQLCFFVHLRNVSQFIRKIEEALNLGKTIKAILELTKLIAAVFVVLHIFACLWYWAGYYSQINYGVSWLNLRNLADQRWQGNYLRAFYYSTVTMFTVGYGDITPQSDLETIISILFMMVTSIQLSYSVSTVGAIIEKISAYEENKLRRLRTITTYMQNKKIGYHLQYQIREYLNYYWKAENAEQSSQEKEIINQLSEHLKERLMFEANSLILEKCLLFKKNFSDILKTKLVKQIRQVVFQPEDIIDFDRLIQVPGISQNQIFICFIEQGSIEVFMQNEFNTTSSTSNSNVSVVSLLNQGESIGDVSFITGKRAPERYKSVGFTKLLILNREDFLKVVVEFPEDYEQFLYLKDQIINYQKFESMQMNCFSCKSSVHTAMDCPLLHFIPDREFLIKKVQFSRDQKRNEPIQNQSIFERRAKSQQSYNARIDQDYVQEQATIFKNEHWKESQFFDCYDDEYFISLQPSQIQLQNDNEGQKQDQDIKKRQTNQNNQSKIDTALIVKAQDTQITQPLKRSNKPLIQVKLLKAVQMIKILKQPTIGLNCQMSEISLSVEQTRINKLEFERNQIKILTWRKKCLEQMVNVIFERDSQAADFLLLRLQMKIDTKALSLFEEKKSFKFYFPKNNLEEVLFKYETYYKPNKQLVTQLPIIFSQFVQYLSYPYQYIERYKFKTTDIPLPQITTKLGNEYKSIINSSVQRIIRKSIFNDNKKNSQSQGAMFLK